MSSPDKPLNIYGTTEYPQHCLCQNPEPDGEREGRAVALCANDCHIHNLFPRHFMANGDNLDCDCPDIERPT